jgi:hypothetical protein
LQLRVLVLRDELDQSRDDAGVDDELDGGVVSEGHDFPDADETVVLFEDIWVVD